MSVLLKALKKLRRDSKSSLALPDGMALNKSRSMSADAVHLKHDLFTRKLHKNQGKDNEVNTNSKSEMKQNRVRRGSEPANLANRKRGSFCSSNGSTGGSAEDVHEQRLSHIAQLNRYIENLKTSVNDDNISFVPSRMCCAQLLRRVYFQQERAYVKGVLHAKEGQVPRAKSFHHSERSPDENMTGPTAGDPLLDLVHPKSYYRNCRSLHNVSNQNQENKTSVTSLSGDSTDSDEDSGKRGKGFYISSESLADESDSFQGRPTPTCRTRHYSIHYPSVAQQNDIEIF